LAFSTTTNATSAAGARAHGTAEKVREGVRRERDAQEREYKPFGREMCVREVVRVRESGGRLSYMPR
jgi:hypothetical protein